MAKAEGPAQGLGFLPASEGTFKQKMTRSVILQENSCSGEVDVHYLQCAQWKFIWKWFASESVVSLALSAWLMTHDQNCLGNSSLPSAGLLCSLDSGSRMIRGWGHKGVLRSILPIMSFLCGLTVRAGKEEFHPQPRPVILWEAVLDGECAELSPLEPLSSIAAKKP